MSPGRTGPTHIGRPLDPSRATNRAILYLIPFGVAVAGVVTLLSGQSALATLGAEAAVGGVVVLGTWALGRELAPDDQRAAFLAMALGFATSLVVRESSVLLVFVLLGLVRTVNRTVGPPARITDSTLVLVLVGWAALSLDSPDLWLIAALAFGLDAGYPDGRARQWGFAALSILSMAAQLGALRQALEAPGTGTPLLSPPGTLTLATTAPISVAFAWLTFRTRTVEAVADLTEEPLSAPRVRAGMIVALLGAATSLGRGETGGTLAALLWAVLAGVSLSGLLRLSGSLPRRGR